MAFTTLSSANWHGLPRIYPADGTRTAALFIGGVGCDRTCTFDSIYGPFTRALVDVGIPVFSADTLAHTWGNDSAMNAISSLRTLAGGAPYNAKISKVLLIGQSQGSLNALGWAMRNPTLVAAVACLLPIPSLATMHDSPGTPSYTTDIEAAYGGLAAYQAAVATHDPDQNRAGFVGLPIKFWYSDNDPTAPPSAALNFASAVGVPTVDMGALGHSTDATLASSVASYLLAYS